MNTITMSRTELSRIEIFERLKQKTIKQKKAASLLGISVRQVRRLVRRYRKDGPSGLVNLQRGTKSHNLADDTVLQTAITTIKKQYWDFSVTLAYEKLVENHKFPYSRETLRKVMIIEGIWKPTPISKSRLSMSCGSGDPVWES